MKENIEKALKNLESANFQGYFAEMDKLQDFMSSQLKTLHSTHKGEFMEGKYAWNFHQQLAVFAKEVLQNNSQAIDETQRKSLEEYADKIYNKVDKTELEAEDFEAGKDIDFKTEQKGNSSAKFKGFKSGGSIKIDIQQDND